MIGIDLFAGAGGMSLGASAAGVKIKIAVEIDKYAAEIRKPKDVSLQPVRSRKNNSRLIHPPAF